MQVFIGYDQREREAYRVCERSLLKQASQALNVHALDLHTLREQDLYTRPHEYRDGLLWDVISDKPMSTEFSLSRFLVPHLMGYAGWALYVDCDFLFRADVAELFALAEPAYAVMVVKHHYIVPNGRKMDGQVNRAYARKNWSSLMLFNCGHPHNRRLSLSYVNARPRDELHGFAWLHDWEIGALPFEWNWLDLKPRAVHFTHGTPSMAGYEAARYAEEYRGYL